MGKLKTFLTKLKKIKPYLPHFFKVSHDGGKNSGVTGYWLIEWKPVFSIVLLKFNTGTREAYHEHAFNALTFWIKGKVIEEFQDGSDSEIWTPSFKPKYTPRNNFHRIRAIETSYAICFRGRWKKTWREELEGEVYTLTNGREKVE